MTKQNKLCNPADLTNRNNNARKREIAELRARTDKLARSLLWLCQLVSCLPGGVPTVNISKEAKKLAKRSVKEIEKMKKSTKKGGKKGSKGSKSC